MTPSKVPSGPVETIAMAGARCDAADHRTEIAIVFTRGWWQDEIVTTAPYVPSINVYAALVDITPVTVTITAGRERIEWPTTVDDVLTNQALWRQMHLADWNLVPENAADPRDSNVC